MTRWSLFLQTLSLLHHFLGLYFLGRRPASPHWPAGYRVDPDPQEVPGVAVETTPGDVVLWQNRMWHYAMKRSDGTPRHLLQNQYFMDPKEDAVEQKWLPGHLNARIGNGEHPFLYSKAMMKKGGPAREKMASRLEELGVTGVRK